MTSYESRDERDPFNLNRFVSAQEGVFEVALEELRRGRKETHWMWFIFPQMAGLGASPTARRFAISGLEEARAYLGHPVLGPRLLQCCRAVLSVEGTSAFELLGSPDDLKLRSSMTLFGLVAAARPEFGDVLAKYFEGEQDGRTVELVKARAS